MYRHNIAGSASLRIWEGGASGTMVSIGVADCGANSSSVLRSCLDLLLNGKFIAPLLFGGGIFQQDLGRVPCPEHDGSEHGPHLLISPVFAEDVGWIEVSRDVPEVNGSRCNGFT